MPQNQSTAKEEWKELPDISDDDYRFVCALLQNRVASQAYQEIFPGRRVDPYKAASELKHSERIQAWIRAGKAAHMQNVEYTLERHVRELDELAEAARKAGNYGAAAQCRIHIGKANGLYVERFEDVGKGRGKADASLLEQVEKLLGAQAALQAAEMLGIEQEEPAAPAQNPHTSDVRH